VGLGSKVLKIIGKNKNQKYGKWEMRKIAFLC